jgi:hypothetical protein
MPGCVIGVRRHSAPPIFKAVSDGQFCTIAERILEQKY